MDVCEISSTVQAGRRVLTVAGEVDLSVSARFEAAIAEAATAVEPGTELVLDLTGVGFLDSSGLRALLRGARTARTADAALRVVPSEAVARVLAIANVGPETLPVSVP